MSYHYSREKDDSMHGLVRMDFMIMISGYLLILTLVK